MADNRIANAVLVGELRCLAHKSNELADEIWTVGEDLATRAEELARLAQNIHGLARGSIVVRDSRTQNGE